MRTKAATAVVALLALAAVPAALAKGSVTIDAKVVATLKVVRIPAAPVALTRKDKLRSCQVAAPRSRFRGMSETQRRAATVACEQPPRPNIDLSGALKSAQTAAIAAAG